MLPQRSQWENLDTNNLCNRFPRFWSYTLQSCRVVIHGLHHVSPSGETYLDTNCCACNNPRYMYVTLCAYYRLHIMSTFFNAAASIDISLTLVVFKNVDSSTRIDISILSHPLRLPPSHSHSLTPSPSMSSSSLFVLLSLSLCLCLSVSLHSPLYFSVHHGFPS